MKKVLAGVLVLLFAASLHAASNLAWDIAAPDATTAATYTFRYYVNGATTGVVVSGVTCTGTVTVTCQIPFPAVPNGNDTIVVTAQAPGGPESGSSPTFSFPMAATPANVRSK